MIKLPAYLSWRQSLNFMVTGEPRDCDPLVIEMERELGAPCLMSVEVAEAALLDRLESGAAIALGEKREAISVNGYRTDSLPSEIPASAWPNLRLDDSSFAAIDRLKVSIPGQGYANVRLRRDDVLAARDAVLAEQRAEQMMLVSLLAPLELAAVVAPPDTCESGRERKKRLAREANAHLAASAKDAIASGEPLPGADAMWGAMPRPKISRPKFRQLHKAALAEHGVEGRRWGRPAS